jgi:hypothetical protein
VTDLLTIQDPRDVDNVLLRVPSGLRRRVVAEAKGQKVSQNTVITSSLLYQAVVFGALPRVGMPKNVVMLLAEMDKAIEDDDAVLGALNEKDWGDVRPFVELFAESGIIEGLKARRDRVGSETVAFTFHFSKAGAAAWRLIGGRLRDAALLLERDRGFFSVR